MRRLILVLILLLRACSKDECASYKNAYGEASAEYQQCRRSKCRAQKPRRRQQRHKRHSRDDPRIVDFSAAAAGALTTRHARPRCTCPPRPQLPAR